MIWIIIFTNLIWLLLVVLLVGICRTSRSIPKSSFPTDIFVFSLWNSLSLNEKGEPVFPSRVVTMNDFTEAMAAVYFKEMAPAGAALLPAERRAASGVVVADANMSEVSLVYPTDTPIRVLENLRKGMDLARPTHIKVRVAAGKLSLG